MGDRGGVSSQESTVLGTMRPFVPLNSLFVLSPSPSSPLSIVRVRAVRACVWGRRAYLHRCTFLPGPRSHRRLPSGDPPGAADHHRPDARPAADPAQPRPRHHADHHAPDPPDPELGPRTGGQPAPGAGAAGARVRHHLHAVRVSLHTHALHIGIPH